MNRRGFFGAAVGAALSAKAMLAAKVAAKPVTGLAFHKDAFALVGPLPDTFKCGDVISFPGVFSVNPMTYRPTGVLRRFVVTADATSDKPLGYFPPAIADGIYKNVSKLPAGRPFYFEPLAPLPALPKPDTIGVRYRFDVLYGFGSRRG